MNLLVRSENTNELSSPLKSHDRSQGPENEDEGLMMRSTASQGKIGLNSLDYPCYGQQYRKIQLFFLKFRRNFREVTDQGTD